MSTVSSPTRVGATPGSGEASPPAALRRDGAPGGTGESQSTLSSLSNAVVVTRSFGVQVWSGIKYVPCQIAKFFRGILDRIVVMIYGISKDDKVEVVTRGWLGHEYVTLQPLEMAIRGKYKNKESGIWTAEYAIKVGKCSEDWVRTRGLHIIEFKYKGWFGESDMKMKLSSAVRDGYFTWQGAVDKKYITQEQAIRGGHIKDPKATPAKK